MFGARPFAGGLASRTGERTCVGSSAPALRVGGTRANGGGVESVVPARVPLFSRPAGRRARDDKTRGPGTPSHQVGAPRSAAVGPPPPLGRGCARARPGASTGGIKRRTPVALRPTSVHFSTTCKKTKSPVFSRSLMGRTILGGGSLGSCVDEVRSQLRELV